MIRLILLLLLPFAVQASPFVISDITSQEVTHCGWVLDSDSKIDIPVQTNILGGKYCRYDLAPVSKGSHTLKATFVNQDPIWGRAESVFSSPFDFTKPSGVIVNPPLELKFSQ